MWNSLGSLRERVREHAKSAAQVAQGVLQAAAAEEDYPPEPEPDNQQEDDTGWGEWGQHDQEPNRVTDNSTSARSQSQPVPLPPSHKVPPPPTDDALPPPPPPEDSFVSAKPPVLNAVPQSRRGSRYVVTGVATSEPQGAVPVVPKPEPQNQKEVGIGWGGWGQPDQDPNNDTDNFTSARPQSEPVPPPPSDDVPPPPADDALPPPPPPEDSFLSAKPPVLNAVPQGRRGSRYVVTGVATSEPQGTAPDVPQPEPGFRKGFDINWGGWGNPDQDPNNNTDNFTSARPQSEPVPPPPSDDVPPPPSDDVPPPPSDDVPPPPSDDAPPPPPPEDSFVSAKPPVLNAVPQSRRGSRYVVTGVATSEPQGTEPVVPKSSFFAPKPPVISSQPVDDDVEGETDTSDTISGIREEASAYPPVDVNESRTTIHAEPDLPSSALPEGSLAPENAAIPEASAFPTSVPEPAKADENLFGEQSKTEPSTDDSFAAWGLPAEQQNGQSTTAPTADNSFPGWGVEVSATEHEQPETVPPPPVDDGISSWNVPETTTEQQQDGGKEAKPVDDNFSGWDVRDVPVETTLEQQKSQSATVDPAEDSFANWSVPERSIEQNEIDGPTETPADDTFARWDVPELSTEQERVQSAEAQPTENSFVSWSVPKSTVEAEQKQTTEAPPEADRFASWSIPETSMDEQKSQSTTAATTDSNFADWSVPDPSSGQRQNEENGWDLGNSATKPNEPQQGDDSQKEEAFADWGNADGEWNLGGGSSGAQNASDGVDWFSNRAMGVGVQDTSYSTTKEATTTNEEPSKEVPTTEATEPEKNYEPITAPKLSTPTFSEEAASENKTKEVHDVTFAPISQPDSRSAEDTALADAKKDSTDSENHKFKISSGIPDPTSHSGNNAWSLDATVATAENGTDAASSSVEEGQWNLQTAVPVVTSQEPISQKPIISSGPSQPAESWFSDVAQETAQDTVPHGEAQNEPALYEARSTHPAQEAFTAQSSEMALQISELQEQMRNFMLERDSAIAAKEESERENSNLKRSIALIESDLAHSREECGYLAAQHDSLQKERDAVLEHKMEVEKERDEAVQRGGEGLREARNVIEAMRSNQDSTEKREAAITEQIEALRTDLDRISQERNTLLGEAEDLRVMLRDVETQSRQREDELRQRLQIAEHESEIARLEREKALETNELHMDENHRLTDAEKGRAAALAASESRVVELENYIASMQTDREDENMRIEFFSKQLDEMKDRTQGVIDERNELYDEKRNLEDQIEEYKQREEAFTRGLHDAKREAASLASERDEAKQRYVSMKDQQKELTKRVEALAGERDQLVQARTAATASSSSVSEKERALAMECEQKTRAAAILQKKLTTAIAKIEKVTAQRSTFQRQRDEAGARLRAAGAEFASLNSKLEDLSIAKNTVQNQLVEIRDERDTALSRLEEMISLKSQLELTQDNLDSKAKEIEDLQSKLKESKREVATMHEANATAQQKVSSLVAELSELQGKLEVVSREKDLISTQKDDLEQEKSALQETVLERESTETQLSKQLKSIEADYTTLKEKSAMDLGITKAELASEQKLHQELKLKLADLQNELSQSTSVLDQIRRTVASCAESVRSDIVSNSEAVDADWQSVDDLLSSEGDLTGESTANLVSRYNEISVKLIRDSMNIAQEYKTLQAKYDDSAKLLFTLEQDKAELLTSASEAETLRDEIANATRDLKALHVEKVHMGTEIGNLQEQLGHAAAQRAELEARIEAVTDEMQEEMQRRIQLSTEEQDRLLHETEKVTTNLNSIWSMLRKSLGEEQMEVLTDEVSQYGEREENVAVLALRGTASIVAEISRNRSHIEDIESKLLTAEAEVSRLIDRAEIAEQERDTAKGTNERLERKLKVSHAEGQEEAKAHYEAIIGQMEDALDDTRQELSRISDKASRSEKETGELRALCSKLTSQFNGRTNELDEAEEKVVYLQDQVTTLEEDLEDAHARLKKLEEESAEARQSDVQRLTDKLEETTAQLEEIEKECARLRGEHDEAENVAKECRLLADTHKQAEENLQIAIEQLEAAQESAVEQRTIELQKKLEDAEQRCKAATEREATAAVTQKQLNIRDEEIKELRGAIGRLADERVELKLELEKSLSRLNHPDAGGQLVDRRVVRQLLVSYFRVGSVRRRDVLELMSRMLAFSDSDNIAVGLKRRALMDRLGSLVQAPELDDATLPPLGTVSDKWIEFLMKETEEGEEQAKGW